MKAIKERNQIKVSKFIRLSLAYIEAKKDGNWHAQIAAQDGAQKAFSQLPKYERENIKRELNES